MRRLIRADLKRVLKKKSLVIIFIVAMLSMIIRIMAVADEEQNFFAPVYRNLSSFTLFHLALGVVMFNSIYADDFKAMSFATVIGRGISRKKVVIAKLLDITILTVIIYSVMAIILTGICNTYGFEHGHALSTVWYGYFVILAYRTIGYLALASMILYITNNIPVSTIVLVILYIAMPYISVVLQLNENIKRLHLERINYVGLADSALADFVFGDYSVGMIKMLIGLVLYLGAVIITTGIWFDKKELEF